jgi:hypothetical protein
LVAKFLRAFAARFGLLGLIAYLSGPLKSYLPVWAIVALVLPFVPSLLQGAGERLRARRTADVIAAWWYVILTAVAAFYFVNGYRPPWWGSFVFFIVLGLVAYVPKLRPTDEKIMNPAIDSDRVS